MQTNFTLAQLADPDIAEANGILRNCVHCGFCTATCPTYQVLGDELDSPRGRIYLIKDMLENDRDPDEKTVKHIDRCLSCLACMTTCPSGVHYMHLVDHAREYIEQTYRRPMFERVLIASDTDHETQVPSGISRLVDHLWSSERLEVVQAGGRHGRVERLRRIVDHPIVRRTLRVCWENHDGAYNCCRCRKCLITMIGLEALGVRGSFPTFPGDLDLDLLAEAELTQMIQLVMWEDTLDAAQAAGRIDLAAPVARLVGRGKRNLGLPPSYRSRAATG